MLLVAKSNRDAVVAISGAALLKRRVVEVATEAELSLQRFGLKVNTTKKFAMLHVSSPQLQPSCHLGRSATGS